MFFRMVKLRLLNTIAPAYFYTATVVTLVLHFLLFTPTVFQSPDVALNPTMLVHIAVFLFLMGNALGNYTMTIWYPSESANETVIPVCSPDCPDRIDAHYLLNGRHFCKNPLTFLTLLPLFDFRSPVLSGYNAVRLAGYRTSERRFLLSAASTSSPRADLVRGTWRANLTDVFGSRWALGLFLPVQTVETVPGNWQVYHDHKHE
ncbi:hypothetical protein M9458_035136 [Cirrhinus mrigala]|uniref:Uncharacterized protein n=1 Tax=Cirrhinus mrigala TaxID=683832 RepID=A0ABD0P9H3_CIRMR